MIGFVDNIEKKALENTYFREVLYTGQHSQLVVMNLLPNEDIGMEIHEIVDQFIRIEEGAGKAILNGEEYVLENGSALVIPAGTEHNIINASGEKELKLYTVYSPAHHKDKTIHKTKADALKDKEDFI